MSYNYSKEACEALKEIADESMKRHEAYAERRNKNQIATYDEVQDIKEHYAFLKEHKENYHNVVLNELMNTALNAVYISALQKEHELSATDIKLAESMVGKFVEEQGGAKAMIRSMKGTTAFKDAIACYVEDAAEEAEDKSDEDDKDFEEVPEESKEEMLDKMEKDDSVDDAVEIIASRIATAEEEFIKKNKEDKDKIDALAADINNRIEAVKADPTVSDEVKDQTEEELKQEMGRLIHKNDYNMTTSIYEHMIRSMANTIMRDRTLREVYCTENGKISMDKTVKAGTVIYGFLEFVNTTKLVNVDKDYVVKIVSEFH
jgi:hypothetical protein